MQKMQILFPEPQLRELRRIADAQDRPVSELVRSAVDFWLARQSEHGDLEVREAPPTYQCGAIRIEAAALRERAHEDRAPV